MSDKKYTPGLWTRSETMEPYGWDIRAGDIWVATVNNDHYTAGERPPTGFPGNIEGKANADLMVAAPKLLEACEKARDEIGVPTPEYPANIANASEILDTIIAECKGTSKTNNQ